MEKERKSLGKLDSTEKAIVPIAGISRDEDDHGSRPSGARSLCLRREWL